MDDARSDRSTRISCLSYDMTQNDPEQRYVVMKYCEYFIIMEDSCVRNGGGGVLILISYFVRVVVCAYLQMHTLSLSISFSFYVYSYIPLDIYARARPHTHTHTPHTHICTLAYRCVIKTHSLTHSLSYSLSHLFTFFLTHFHHCGTWVQTSTSLYL